ncbi:hypothetical protein ABC977_14265 [Thioalkalicoccus limnaeus]|uniref:Uncharacterized protein n=1 Tax=Thioalkalicoccus limnaeus TaxID=120681 RepID=A0ABV4BJB3_9GAMM
MHVNLRGIDRSAVFFDEADRQRFLAWLGAAAAQESVAGHAYATVTPEKPGDYLFYLCRAAGKVMGMASS